MSAHKSELGDLGPIRDTLDWLRGWEEHDRTNRGDDDDVARALALVAGRLEDALTVAARPEQTVTLEELAEREGVTVAALYKRRQRGRLPGVKKRQGRLVVPVSNLAA